MVIFLIVGGVNLVVVKVVVLVAETTMRDVAES